MESEFLIFPLCQKNEKQNNVSHNQWKLIFYLTVYQQKFCVTKCQRFCIPCVTVNLPFLHTVWTLITCRLSTWNTALCTMWKLWKLTPKLFRQIFREIYFYHRWILLFDKFFSNEETYFSFFQKFAQSGTQCGNCRNFLSHTFFTKISWKHW